MCRIDKQDTRLHLDFGNWAYVLIDWKLCKTLHPVSDFISSEKLSQITLQFELIFTFHFINFENSFINISIHHKCFSLISMILSLDSTSTFQAHWMPPMCQPYWWISGSTFCKSDFNLFHCVAPLYILYREWCLVNTEIQRKECGHSVPTN